MPANEALVLRVGNIRLDRKGKDKWGRTIAIVLSDGRRVNKELVAVGHAWAYTRYSRSYVSEEKRARDAGLGLWAPSTCPPIHPEYWRQGYR